MRLDLIDSWLVYHVGLFCMQEDELRLGRTEWLGKYNSSWHESSESRVFSALQRLASQEILFSDNGDKLQLTPRGQQFWSSIARPNWDQSYRWTARAPKSGLWDQRIEIRAASYETVISVIARDINCHHYIAIDTNKIEFKLLREFYPLRWHCVPNGVQISFDSLFQSIPVEIIERVYSLTKGSEPAWYLGFSEAMELM